VRQERQVRLVVVADRVGVVGDVEAVELAEVVLLTAALPTVVGIREATALEDGRERMGRVLLALLVRLA
jgi:hypothetical protein